MWFFLPHTIKGEIGDRLLNIGYGNIRYGRRLKILRGAVESARANIRDTNQGQEQEFMTHDG